MDDRRTPVGWTPDDAVERATIQRVIVAMISAEPREGAAALPCGVPIQLRSKEQTREARIREVRPGGLLVETDHTWVVGTHVDMHLRGEGWDDHGIRARGVISRVDAGTVLVSVAAQPSDAHERRLTRFLDELLRHRAHT
ncbi:MAG: PilZ domain-containing protein [Kofleriaceae bacterium]|nr:PilZ domain-containing protein [Kofleriaceae bacterium]MCB9573400.1 PilZ domain-containing protein [Kofleriaceae bacterium]